MRSNARFLMLALLGSSLSLSMQRVSRACTTFRLSGDASELVGKSYDWNYADGIAYVNKRGVQKKSLQLDPSETPASWTSKYGSLSFSQAGREFPLGGMNEKGLVVEILWLADTSWEPRDTRPALNELQWIQFQLDTAANVEEAVQNAQRFRVDGVFAKVHYFVCDATPSCATIEFIDGQLVAHKKLQPPYAALTNDTYENSVAALAQHRGFGGSEAAPTGFGSMDRFVRASMKVEQYGGGNGVDYAFSILNSVYTRGFSRWNIVYDMAQKKIYFREAGSRSQAGRVDLNSFDMDCSRPVKMIDVRKIKNGDVTSGFSDYSDSDNRRFVQDSFRAQGAGLPPVVADLLSNYPSTTRCH
jgi:choloylglycine hydrolase